jgi:FAD/FMN-containing dehydrogenase
MSELSRRDFLGAGATAAAALYLPFAADAKSAAWQARAANARVSKRALKELARALRGGLLLPGDPAYDRAMTPANSRYDGIKPVAVTQCLDEHDVVTSVNWARAHGVPPVVRGGGHSYAGYSMTTGLMIDLGLMTRVHVNPHTGLAVMDGAALNQHVFDATVNGDYVLPGGTCLAVGVGGLALGGGVGYNTHWAGLTADHLVCSRIVTADGQARRTDAKHHSDLFWACRGGAGGSFGVNTQLTFHLQRIPRHDVAFYRFDWRGAEAAAAVLGAFDHVLAKAPAALNAVAQAQAVPLRAGENKRDAITVFSRGQYIGPLSELKELVQPLITAAGTPIKVQLETFSYWEMQRMFASAEAERHGFGDLSRYSNKPLPDRVHAKVADVLANCPSRDASSNGSMWSLGWIGGPVVDSFAPRHTAYVHRNMLTMLRATPVWASDAPKSVQHDLIAWTNEMVDVIRPYTPNESYQNFPNRLIKDWPQQYYGENYPRLVTVKTKYDPHNLFHNPQSIRPRRR